MIISVCGDDENMGQFKVRDIMTTQVVALSPENTVREATRKLAVENLAGAPVVDKGNHMVGILSQNDILGLILKCGSRLDAAGLSGNDLLSTFMEGNVDPKLKEMLEELSNTKVEDIMVRNVLTTSPDASIMSLLKSMVTMDVSRVPVVDRGVLLGIVSRSDIMFSLYKKKMI